MSLPVVNPSLPVEVTSDRSSQPVFGWSLTPTLFTLSLLLSKSSSDWWDQHPLCSLRHVHTYTQADKQKPILCSKDNKGMIIILSSSREADFKSSPFSYAIHLVCAPVQYVSQICSLGGQKALLLDLCCPCDGLVSSSVYTAFLSMHCWQGLAPPTSWHW